MPHCLPILSTTPKSILLWIRDRARKRFPCMSSPNSTLKGQEKKERSPLWLNNAVVKGDRRLHWSTRGETPQPLLFKVLNPCFCLMTILMSKHVSGVGQRRQVCLIGAKSWGTFSEGPCWGVRHDRNQWPSLPPLLKPVSWHDLF